MNKLVLSLCCGLLLLSSCRTARSSIDGMISADVKYNISTRSKAQALSGRLFIVPNKSISLTANASILNIQVAQLQATPDTLTILDRINGLYMQEPFGSLLIDSTPVTFAATQELFLQNGKLQKQAQLKYGDIVLDMKLKNKRHSAPQSLKLNAKHQRISFPMVLELLKTLTAQ